ncbi:hypothetical protein LTR37_014640 [Vermiconidia calcicola]|uniref:Uncharacterized protein n=1 Tax=Vermiconidia calcicola TaxID=1690605 RepID=A0ACC3MT44_9PEZI|nr:hypothetical protein LTR37_014640 [Vermiconidia calcicola]
MHPPSTPCWTAVSREVFLDAAPLVLSKPLLYVYTGLKVGESFATTYDQLLEQTFPADYYWTRPIARAMVQNLAVTVRFPTFYNSLSMPERLSTYFADLKGFTGLRELRISCGPDCLPGDRDRFDTIVSLYRSKRLPLSPDLQDNSPILSRLYSMVKAVKEVIPDTCNVVWRFDGAGMPSVPAYIVKRKKVIKHLVSVNKTMQRLWDAMED